jgi:hypothetical protein
MRSGGRVSASATGAVPLPDPMNHQETGAYRQFCPLQCKRRRDGQGVKGSVLSDCSFSLGVLSLY